MLPVDYRALISQADLIYHSPVEQSVEGQPIGNGRMGTLVWTTVNAIHCQINRNDVFALNREHLGQQFDSVDYCGGGAAITLDLGNEVFCGEVFEQRLSLYEAEVSVTGNGVRIRCFISAVTDVLVLEVDDRREKPQPVRLSVSMWREPQVKTGAHVAGYQFDECQDGVILVQRFEEGDYHGASAVAAQVVRAGITIAVPNHRSRTIVAPANNGPTMILISSAASLNFTEGLAGPPLKEMKATALKVLQEASDRSYDALVAEHRGWWSNFWSRTFVQVESKDGLGEFMARLRNLHLYNLAATSRGMLPPKWNGSLFTTEGDTRRWGSQFWVWTTEMLYFPLFAADAIELTEPYFSMYLRHLPACQKAAQQRWGVSGAFFPETTSFDGPTVLPDDIAVECRDVLLGQKTPPELSARAFALCQFDSHLRAATNPTAGRYTWISHLVSSGSELAVQAWWRYRYRGEQEWLRTGAYPLLRETVEFYRHLVRKGDDGCYHLDGMNVHEDFWGVKDGIMDLAALRGTVPLAIIAAERLDVDAELRAKWQELLDNLAPYPMGYQEESKALSGGVLADDVWAAGQRGEVDGQHNPEDVWLTPVFPFEDWTLETREGKIDDIVQRALDLAPWMPALFTGAKLGTAIRTPIVWCRAGRGEQLPALLASYYAAFTPLPNGFSLFEGQQAHSVEHLGCISTVLQEALLQSLSPRPGKAEVVSVFPAWPKEWDASFRLLARGGFLVTSAVRNGEVEFVALDSRAGETCRIRNPWHQPCLLRELDGEVTELEGEILNFETEKGKHYRLLPKGKEHSQHQIISPPKVTQASSYSLKLPNGTVHQSTLGRK
ncbi:hypothetical protein FJZ31_38265 [Candidatus Poribacteria bacterium]|nr:hypothetical protein [Candidatus Poribacteria bacterium]